jgi:hydroxypyruvate reductase
MAAAADGVDGKSGTAGAIVDGAFASRAGDALARATERFDTGPLHLRVGSALPRQPTGHNLADLHILVRS